LILLLLLLFLTECRTPNDENGVCIDIRNCTKLISLLQDPNTTESDMILLRNSICGFEGRTSKVCCPLDKTIPEDTLSSQMTCGQRQLSADRIIGGSQSQLGRLEFEENCTFHFNILLLYRCLALDGSSWLSKFKY